MLISDPEWYRTAIQSNQLSQLMRLWLVILCRLIIQTRMCSHPVGLDVRFFGRTHHLLTYFMCANSEGSGKTAQMHRLARASLVACVISTIISWAGSIFLSSPHSYYSSYNLLRVNLSQFLPYLFHISSSFRWSFHKYKTMFSGKCFSLFLLYISSGL